MSEIKLEQIPTGTTLYHGSQRLFNILCYIKSKRPLLDRYIKDVATVSVQASLDRVRKIMMDKNKFYTMAVRAFHRFECLWKCNNQQPWTQQVVLLFGIEQMYNLGESPFRLSYLFEALLPEVVVRERVVYRTEYTNCIIWMRKIETATPSEDDQLLAQQFYSVMRMPIQFFGPSFDDSASYAKLEEAMFVYKTTAPLTVVNISDKYTAEMLCRGKRPFASIEPYDEKTIKYYTESTRDALMEEVLVPFFTPMLVKLSKVGTKERLALNKIGEKYRWSWASNSELSSEDPDDFRNLVKDIKQQQEETGQDEWAVKVLGDSKTWADVVQKIVVEMHEDQPMLWEEMAKRTPASGAQQNLLDEDTDLYNDAIVKMILSRFPTIPTIATWSTFAEFMNQVWQIKSVDARQAVAIAGRPTWIAFLQSLANFFHLSKHAQTFLANDTKGGPTDDDLGNAVRLWDTWVADPLISPRALWIITNWKLFTATDYEKQYARTSYYEIDTLLVYSLLTSRWTRKHKINGWKGDVKPVEILVLHPSQFGQMTKYTDSYPPTHCDYKLTST